MFSVEPPRTDGDLNFRLVGVPVRIQPLFWFTTILLGLGFGRSGPTPPAQLVIWVFAVTLSILVHELGHAVMQRRFGGRPWITLHGLGGLASCDDCDRSFSSQIQISIAGPGAGFAFAVALAAVLASTGHAIGWLSWGRHPHATLVGLANKDVLSIAGSWLYWDPPSNAHASQLVYFLFHVNIYWGLVNLLPIYPLDGGKIAREICQVGRGAARGFELSLLISIAAGAATALYGLTRGSFYLAFLFGYLAYNSYRTWNVYRRR